MKYPLLVTNKYNLEYLLSFTGSNGFMLILKEKSYFFTDGRYETMAKKLLEKAKFVRKCEFVLIDENFKLKWGEIIAKHRISSLQFEPEDLTVKKLDYFKSISGKKVKFIVTDYFIARNYREIKGKSEIANIKIAQKIIEQVFDTVKAQLQIGKTELDIAWEIKALCQKFGADDISFEPIVAFNSNSAMPHHKNTDKKLKKGDIIMIDCGARYKGYCSDMTRMIFTAQPNKKQETVYNAVLEAQELAIKSIKAQIKASKPDLVARAYLKRQGLNKFFTHSLGHGVGLEVHDPTISLSKNSKTVLKEGMVVTIEPGVYLEGEFGVRIEDMGVVTKNGIEIFTKTPKSLQKSLKFL